MDANRIEAVIDEGSLEAVDGALKEIDDIFAAQQRRPIDDYRQLVNLAKRLADRRDRLACISGCNLTPIPIVVSGAHRPPVTTIPGLSQEDNSRAVALLTDVSLLADQDSGRLQTRTFREVYGICSNEPFAALPVSIPATAFLVGKGVIATLRHNLALFNGDTTRIRVLFDFGRQDPNDPFSTKIDFLEEEVFKVERELRSEIGDGFVTLQLDKDPGRLPVKCNFTQPLTVGQKVYMVGHPYGLPKILADNARVLDTSAQSNFTADLDAFPGNSSSIVVNADTGLVEGALAQGESRSLRTVRRQDGSSCYVFLDLEPSQTPGYRVRRIQALEALL